MKKRGFTLIELIVVIVILGILAAFAVPRFIGIDKNARKATVDSLGGSLRAASALAHAVALATGAGASDTISMEGASVTMINKYPTADSTGIAAALSDSSGFSVSHSGSISTYFPTGAAASSTCQAVYDATVNPPTVTVTSTNCA